MIQCDCNILHAVVSRTQLLVNKNFFHLLFFHLLSSFIYYFSIWLLQNMRLTTSQNALHFGMKCSKYRRFLGLRPRPAEELTTLSPDPLVCRCFLPSAITASHLRRLQFPQLHVYRPMRKLKFPNPRASRGGPLGAYSTSIFFTSNMSHYLKSLKICPELQCNPMSCDSW